VSDARPGESVAPPEPPLEWTLNPWRVRPTAAALGLGLVAIAALGIALLELPALSRAALALGFAGLLAPAFLPTRYRLDQRGVASRMLLLWDRRDWAAFKRARVADAPGEPRVRLSTLDRPGPLEPFRGMTLRLPGRDPDRDRLLGEVRRRLALHGL
jgi:hypothetical protein